MRAFVVLLAFGGAAAVAEGPDAVALLGWEEGAGGTRRVRAGDPPRHGVLVPAGARYAVFPFGRKLELRVAVWDDGFAADVDFDADLKEEKKRPWGRLRVVPAPDEPGGVPLRLARAGDEVVLTALAARAGAVVAGGRRRRAVWVDADADWIPEALRLDLDGDAEAAPDETVRVGDIAVLGSRRYRLDTEGFCGRDVLLTERGSAAEGTDGDAFRAARERAEALLDAGSPEEAEATELARTLARAGGLRAVRACLALLPHARAGAVVPLLACVRDDGGVRALRRGLRDRDARVRLAAARALRDVDDDAVAAALERRREREDDPAVRRALDAATRDRVPPDRVRALQRGGLETLPELRRAGLHQGPVRRALARQLRSRDEKIVITALDLLGPHRYRDLLEATRRCLRDRDWRVRATAVEALGRARVRASVEALIDLLGDEDHARVRRIAGDELHRLTGENLRDFADIWRKWWERRGASFVVPPRPPAKRRARKGERKTVSTFFGVELVDRAVVFVLDKSASMTQPAGGRTRWNACLAELERALAELPDGARFDVVTFDTHVWRWQGRLVPANRSTVDDVMDALRKKQPRGGTYLFEGLKAALEIEDVETIYLLSDGEPSGVVSDPDEIIRRTLKLNRFRRAVIHCVAVGYASPWLRRLASLTKGVYDQR